MIVSPCSHLSLILFIHGSPLTVFLLILPRLNTLSLAPISNELNLSHLQSLFRAPFSVLPIRPVTSALSLTKTYLLNTIYPPSAKHHTTIFVKYDKSDPHLTLIPPSSSQTLWFLQNSFTRSSSKAGAQTPSRPSIEVRGASQSTESNADFRST